MKANLGVKLVSYSSTGGRVTFNPVRSDIQLTRGIVNNSTIEDLTFEFRDLKFTID